MALGLGLGFRRGGKGNGLPGFVTLTMPSIVRSGATVTVTFGTYSPTPTGVLKTVYINGVSQSLVGSTFTMVAGDSAYYTELPSSVGYSGAVVTSNVEFYPLPNDIPDANWTYGEYDAANSAIAPEDSRRSIITTTIAPQVGKEWRAYRGTTAGGNLGQLSAPMADISGTYTFISGGQNAPGATVYCRIAETDTGGANPRWATASLAPYTATNIPLAPTGVTIATGSTAGAINATFSVVGDGRGRGILAPYATINGGAAFALTPSGGGTGLRTFTALGTDPVNVSVFWRNANGDSTATTAVSVTPGVAPPTGTDQTAEFGALTLASAGGFQPFDGNDDPIILTSVVSQATCTRTWSIASGRLVANGTPDVDNGKIIVVAHAGGNISLTVNTVANAYSASTVAEMQAVNALGVATLSGKTMLMRHTDTRLVLGGVSWLANRAFTTRFTIRSHKLGKNRARFLMQYNGLATQVDLNGTSNLRLQDLDMLANYKRGVDGVTDYAIRVDGDAPNLEFDGCKMEGDLVALESGPHFRGFIGGDGSCRFSENGITVTNCEISGLSRALNLGGGGRKTISRVRISDIGNDGILIGNNSKFGITDHSFSITDCEFINPFVDTTCVSFPTGACVTRATNLIGAADSQRALLYLRIRTYNTGTLRTIFAMGSALQITQTTTNLIRVVARDTAGNVVIDMTSTRPATRDLQYNLLISLDTTATSRMWSWTELDRTEVQEATQTAASQVLDLTGGNVFIGDDPALTTQYNGALSVVDLWQGIAPDISNSAVRANFYNTTASGLPKSRTLAVAAYGEPILDMRAVLRDWVAGTANKGTGGTFGFTTAVKVDTPHFDMVQGVTNTGTIQTYFVSPGPGLVAGNVGISARSDGQPAPTDAQIFFFEDIQGSYNYQNLTIRDNLFLSASPIGISIYNALNCRVFNNTGAVLDDMVWSTHFDQNPRIRIFEQNGAIALPGVSSGNIIAENIVRVVSSVEPTDILDNNPSVQGETVSGSLSYAAAFARPYPNTISGVNTIAKAREQFATNEAWRTAFAARVGFDGYSTYSPYVAGNTPRLGVSDVETLANVTGAGTSTLVVSGIVEPSGVSGVGIVVYAPGAEVQLLSAADAIVRDYGPSHVVLTAGQKFRVRRLSSSSYSTAVDTIVYYGQNSLTWSITTAAPVVVFEDLFTADTSAAWTETAVTREYNAGTTSLQLRGTSASFPSAYRVFTDANIVIGGVYRVQMSVRSLEAAGSFSLSIGRTGANGAYLNDSRKTGTGGSILVLQTYDVTFTLATAAEIRLMVTSRDSAAVGARWNVEDIIITRVS